MRTDKTPLSKTVYQSLRGKRKYTYQGEPLGCDYYLVACIDHRLQDEGGSSWSRCSTSLANENLPILLNLSSAGNKPELDKDRRSMDEPI